MPGIEVDFKLLRVRQTARRVQRLEQRFARKILRRASRAAARPVHRKVLQLVPVQEGSGRLKRSIKIRAVRRNRRGRFGVTVWTGTRDELDITGSGYYPFSVEYGYRRADGTRVEEQSYMRRALEEEQDQALDIFEREMISGMESELRGVG